MSTKRILLVVAALGLVWFAFFRKPKATANVVGKGKTSTAGSVASAALTPANITAALGFIKDGIVHTFGNTSPGAQGGSNSVAGTSAPFDYAANDQAFNDLMAAQSEGYANGMLPDSPIDSTL